jgi:hypothetical protein
MENVHPALVIDYAGAVQRERLAEAAAAQRSSLLSPRGPTPRLALAQVLFALATRLAPATADARATV